jgi:hypothetical protein
LLGCSNYIVKPVNYERYAAAVNKLGNFITLLKVPTVEC